MEKINIRYENLLSKHQKEIRDAYEGNLLEHGYARHIVSEVNDGRDEFLTERYNEVERYLDDSYDRYKDDKATGHI